MIGFHTACRAVAQMYLVCQPLLSRAFLQDVDRCVAEVACHESLPPVFVEALIAGEDHRYFDHLGIDPLSIIRATVSCVFRNRIEGASTIEQQFVRVVTGRYERTISRKIKEQLLAIALSKRCSKYAIACAYLSIATYGTRLVGRRALELRCEPLLDATLWAIAGMVARLKYPEPSQHCAIWTRKVERRRRHVSMRIKAARAQSATRDQTQTTIECATAFSGYSLCERYGSPDDKISDDRENQTDHLG